MKEGSADSSPECDKKKIFSSVVIIKNCVENINKACHNYIILWEALIFDPFVSFQVILGYFPHLEYVLR